MRVLIVAKTHMSGEMCVGGLARNNNQNIRLLQPGEFYQPVDTPYKVGHIWDINFSPCYNLMPPHVEDVIVEKDNYLGKAKNFKQTLLDRVNVWQGPPEALFDGLLQFTPNGSGYIAHQNGVPQQSVGFWLTTAPLNCHTYKQKTRYTMPNHPLKITFVGTDKPVSTLPANSLLRVSLARWWRPDNQTEARCYLQLSGWYLD